MKEKYVVSYGAGIDSTAMIFWLLDNKKPIDYVIFADTGAELPETYMTVKHMEKRLKKLGIPLITVNPFKDRGLEKRCRDRKVIPDRHHRYCTRDVKIQPIYAFYRKLNCKINQYIGIDASEKRRCKPDPHDAPYIHSIYPLVEAGINREQCVEIIKQHNFPEVVKSGCYFCIYNNMERLYWIFSKHQEMFEKIIEFEEQSKHYPRQTLFPGMTMRKIKSYFVRGKIPKTTKSVGNYKF